MFFTRQITPEVITASYVEFCNEMQRFLRIIAMIIILTGSFIKQVHLYCSSIDSTEIIGIKRYVKHIAFRRSYVYSLRCHFLDAFQLAS